METLEELFQINPDKTQAEFEEWKVICPQVRDPTGGDGGIGTTGGVSLMFPVL